VAFPVYWWIIGAVFVIALYLLGHYLCLSEDVSQVGLYEIDRMTKKDFQHFCRHLLKKVGYQIQRPQRAKQWITFILEKEGERMAVMIRQYAAVVGTRPVEKAAEGAARNDCARAIVLTNRDFTLEARQLAGQLGVELWDRDKLADLLIVARSQGR
jgi:restriction system protein